MIYKNAFLLCVALFILGGPAVLEAATLPAISFQVNGSAVTATGLTPGGTAAVINAWNTSSGDSSMVIQTWRDARVSADGAVEAAFTLPIPTGALIVVIDVATGRVSVTPDGATNFERVALPEKRFKRDAAGEIESIFSPHPAAMLVVVRPGEGAWLRKAHDGGSGDADGSVDGRITTDPTTLQPIAHSAAPPRRIKKRDIVLLIDAKSRLFATTEVSQ